MIKLTLVDYFPYKQEPPCFIWVNPIRLDYVTIGQAHVYNKPTPSVPEKQIVTWVNFGPNREDDNSFAVRETPEEIIQLTITYNAERVAAMNAANRRNYE